MKQMCTILLILLFSLTGCYYYTDNDVTQPFVSDSNDFSKQNSKPTHIIEDNSVFMDPNIKPIEAPRLQHVDPNIIYEIGDSFNHKNMDYRVNSAKVAKELDLFANDVIPDNTHIKSDGSLEDGYSYVIVNMTMKNNSNQKIEIYLNSFCICSIDDNGNYQAMYKAEMCAFNDSNNSQRDINSKGYFKYDFIPDRETTFDFLYIVDEVTLACNMNIVINDVAFSGYEDEDVKFVKIR